MANALEQDISDRAYWEEFADAIGWRLCGWAYRSRASFRTEKPGELQLPLFELRGHERDDIMAAIKQAALNGFVTVVAVVLSTASLYCVA